MRLIILMLITLLVGCAVSVDENDTRDSSYAVISESTINTGGMITPEVGTHICKVTTVGDIKGWQIEFKGDKCSAKLNEGIKDELNNQENSMR